MIEILEQNPRECFLVRDSILKQNGFKSYDEFLESEHWQNVRIKARKKGYYDQCQFCKCDGKSYKINLHHENYRFLFTPFELRSIWAACDLCHEAIHKLAYRFDISFSKAQTLLDQIQCIDHYTNGGRHDWKQKTGTDVMRRRTTKILSK